MAAPSTERMVVTIPMTIPILATLWPSGDLLPSSMALSSFRPMIHAMGLVTIGKTTRPMMASTRTVLALDGSG